MIKYYRFVYSVLSAITSRCLHRFVRVSSIEDAGKIIRKFNHYSFGTKYNLFIKLTESDEERARKRERIKEDEEFYERICQEYKANLEKSGEGLRYFESLIFLNKVHTGFGKILKMSTEGLWTFLGEPLKYPKID